MNHLSLSAPRSESRVKSAVAATLAAFALAGCANYAGISSDKQIASLQTAIDSARKASDSLKAQVTDLKHKIEEGERTATTLVARKNAAMAQRKFRMSFSASNTRKTSMPLSAAR